MQREINFRDLDSKKYRVITFLATILLALGALGWFLNFPAYFNYGAAAISLSLFAFLSMDSFTSSNSMSYNSKSVTLKLLGEKTMGFLFSEVERFNLQEQGLLIKVKEMDAIKLSRKRYTLASLQELHHILQEKTNLT